MILLTFSKLRIQNHAKCRQTLGAKVHCQMGNSPHCWLRSANSFSEKGSLYFNTVRRWAWKQPFFKESVTAHWPRVKAPKI